MTREVEVAIEPRVQERGAVDLHLERAEVGGRASGFDLRCSPGESVCAPTMRKCELARAEVTKATSAPPRVMKPFVVRPARSGSSLAASNHTKPASSSRRAAVATTWCDVGEASRNCRRSSIFASVLPVFACAVRRGARALGALVVERDRDRDVTPQETTGHLAAVALLNAGLDLGDAGRQRVALGEANQMTPANTATSSNLLTTDDTNFSTKSTPSTPTTIATSDASRAFCASNDERSMRPKVCQRPLHRLRI